MPSYVIVGSMAAWALVCVCVCDYRAKLASWAVVVGLGHGC